LVQAFRRPDSPFVRADFRLRGLDPAAMYEVANLDVAGSTKVSGGSTPLTTGKELMEIGLAMEIKDKPGAAVIVYRRVK
jgi:hypothetical protein